MEGVHTSTAEGEPYAVCILLECGWTMRPPEDEPNPAGYLERAAQQHVRDTGHTTATVRMLITYHSPQTTGDQS